MKTLLLIRHAKSSWNNTDISDIDRPLNDRGHKDAPQMARRLRDKGLKIDLFASSPARRARRTARYFAEEYGQKKADILLLDDLYMAAPEAFGRVVAALPDKHDTVALFSHNPGISEFANTLTNVRVDDMPTCAVYALTLEAKHWQDFAPAAKNFLFFDYPRNPLDSTKSK